VLICVADFQIIVPLVRANFHTHLGALDWLQRTPTHRGKENAVTKPRNQDNAVQLRPARQVGRMYQMKLTQHI
jgi:hypothetical protein